MMWLRAGQCNRQFFRAPGVVAGPAGFLRVQGDSLRNPPKNTRDPGLNYFSVSSLKIQISLKKYLQMGARVEPSSKYFMVAGTNFFTSW